MQHPKLMLTIGIYLLILGIHTILRVFYGVDLFWWFAPLVVTIGFVGGAMWYKETKLNKNVK